MYHFSESGNSLHQVVTTWNFEAGFKWNIELSEHIVMSEPDNVTTASLTPKSSATVSWISPYRRNPAQHRYHSQLPYSLCWTPSHLYIVFGACYVYICRIQLQPESTNAESESLEVSPDTRTLDDATFSDKFNPKVEVLKNKVFLPASTVHRTFTFQPHSFGDTDYALFAISGSAEVPPVLVWKDIEKDLGGWTDYDGTNIGQHVNEYDFNRMQGKYAADSRFFYVPIRSGLEWNTVYHLRCGESI